jgi:hypothetical protein
MSIFHSSSEDDQTSFGNSINLIVDTMWSLFGFKNSNKSLKSDYPFSERKYLELYLARCIKHFIKAAEKIDGRNG